jgi:hypothetical protein
MENIQAYIDWVNSNSLLCWFIIYGMIYFIYQIIGLKFGSWYVGMITGICFINGVSIGFAYIATQSQSFPITVGILIVTSIVGILVTCFYRRKDIREEVK